MSAMETQTAKRSSRAVRFFADHADQEAETFRYWGSRTINERLQALGELLRTPQPLILSGRTKHEAPIARFAKLFKNRDEQEAWNLQRASNGKRP
jgi:hypothetical protein